MTKYFNTGKAKYFLGFLLMLVVNNEIFSLLCLLGIGVFFFGDIAKEAIK